MSSIQQSKCNICGDIADLFIDHDHTTGEVRSLLCLRCNCAVGYLRESRDIAIKTKNYIEKWNLRKN